MLYPKVAIAKDEVLDIPTLVGETRPSFHIGSKSLEERFLGVSKTCREGLSLGGQSTTKLTGSKSQDPDLLWRMTH